MTQGAPEGKACVMFHHDKPVPWDVIRTVRVPIDPGRRYTLSALVKRSAPADKTRSNTGLWPHTFETEKSLKFLRRIKGWIPKKQNEFDWKRFDLTFTAGEKEQFIVIWFCDNDHAGDIGVDDFRLAEAPPGVAPKK